MYKQFSNIMKVSDHIDNLKKEIIFCDIEIASLHMY